MRQPGVSAPRILELDGLEAEPGPALLEALADLVEALLDPEARHEQVDGFHGASSPAAPSPALRAIQTRTVVGRDHLG